MPGLLIIYLNEVFNGCWLTKKYEWEFIYLFCLLQLFFLRVNMLQQRGETKNFGNGQGSLYLGKQSNFNSDGKFWCTNLEAECEWSLVQGTHGCAELCLSHALPLCCHCFSGNHASQWGVGAAGSCSHHQDWLDRPSVCNGTAAIHIAPLQNSFLYKYIQKSTGWLGMFQAISWFAICSSKG